MRKSDFPFIVIHGSFEQKLIVPVSSSFFLFFLIEFLLGNHVRSETHHQIQKSQKQNEDFNDQFNDVDLINCFAH
jgi:hypothetical protein